MSETGKDNFIHQHQLIASDSLEPNLRHCLMKNSLALKMLIGTEELSDTEAQQRMSSTITSEFRFSHILGRRRIIQKAWCALLRATQVTKC